MANRIGTITLSVKFRDAYLAFVLCLFATEILFFQNCFQSTSFGLWLDSENVLVVVGGLLPRIAKIGFAALFISILISRQFFVTAHREGSRTWRATMGYWAIHAATYSLVLLPAYIPGFDPDALGDSPSVRLVGAMFYMFVVNCICYPISLLLLLASPQKLLAWIRDRAGLLAVSYSLVLLTRYGMGLAIWGTLVSAWWIGALGRATLVIAILFGQLFKQSFFVSGVSSRSIVFGTQHFQVDIYGSCSGYEGMLAITGILAAYLYAKRRSLRLPSAILILPIAIAAIFFLNALRIAILIMIGTYWSAEVALTGFHTAAGWLNVIGVSVACAFALERFPFFTRRLYSAGEPSSIPLSMPVSAKLRSPAPCDSTNAFLLPVVVWICVGLVMRALSGDFSWLYPITVVATTGVLFHYRASYERLLCDPGIGAIGAGTLVFFLWIMLVPHEAALDLRFGESLFSGAPSISLGWLAFRFTGAVAIVPFIEELAFRGLFQPRIERYLNRKNWKKYATFVSLLVTSLAFGLLHSNILAATLAGIVYGLVKIRRGQLMDAIAAHATTNLLLAIYVLATGYWSYW